MLTGGAVGQRCVRLDQDPALREPYLRTKASPGHTVYIRRSANLAPATPCVTYTTYLVHTTRRPTLRCDEGSLRELQQLFVWARGRGVWALSARLGPPRQPTPR